MTTAASTSAIERATGIDWAAWSAYLDQASAADLPHPEIARLASQRLQGSPVENPGWWAQAVAVAYEQHIGRRKPGQQSDGTFQVGVSRTIPTTLDEALAAWITLVDGRSDLGGLGLRGTASTTRTDRRRRWRVTLSDGSRVAVEISLTVGGRAVVAVTHSRLTDQDAVGRWRTFWKDLLQQLPPDGLSDGR